MVYHRFSSIAMHKDKQARYPRENDVLCGRGSGVYSHVGNQRFREIVIKYQTMYHEVGNNYNATCQKTFIAEKIIHFVQTRNPPGRFLSQSHDKSTWHEVPHDVAVQKTKQALREKRIWFKCDKPCINISKRSTKTIQNIGINSEQNAFGICGTKFKIDTTNQYDTEDSDERNKDLVLSYHSQIQDPSHSVKPGTFQLDEIDMLIIDTFEEKEMGDEDYESSLSQNKTSKKEKVEFSNALNKSMINELYDNLAKLISKSKNKPDNCENQLSARSA